MVRVVCRVECLSVGVMKFFGRLVAIRVGADSVRSCSYGIFDAGRDLFGLSRFRFGLVVEKFFHESIPIAVTFHLP